MCLPVLNAAIHLIRNHIGLSFVVYLSNNGLNIFFLVTSMSKHHGYGTHSQSLIRFHISRIKYFLKMVKCIKFI